MDHIPDPRMDALLRRISSCMEGEHLLDVAAVCADTIVFAIHRQFDNHEERIETLEALLEAMRVTMLRRSVQ